MFVKTANLIATTVYTGRDDFNARRANRKIVEFDPEFVYVAVRALTADKPNSNGDCFPHEELIRIDDMLNRPVYASFISKGVYVNHKNTDDPRYAKGAVLDARYTKDASGDRYVELLLGVDRQKDPHFAKDVERGVINKFSMGASVQFTKCSVCDNVARKREEFCEHIAKYKMRECKDDKTGSKKLAYERCYGVTYNEISAVSDPADESAQLLARVATRNRRSSEVAAPDVSHGTVVQMNEIKTAVARLEDTIMNRRPRTTRTAGHRKTAEPGFGAEPGTEALPGGNMGDPAGDPLAPEGEEVAGDPVVEVLKIVTDMAEGAIPPEQAVQELQGLGIGGDEAGLPPPGEEGGLPEPGAQDMAPMASKFLNRILRATQSKRATTRRRAEEEGSSDSGGKSDKGQYPNYKVQKDPKQEDHASMNGDRPASDFDKDQKEYAKLWNINAEFVPNDDRKLAGWRVSDGDTPLYFVAGGAAFGKHLDSMWSSFASRAYGQELVTAILEQGVEPVMAHVRASKLDGGSKREATEDDKKKLDKSSETAPTIDIKKLTAAAEKKAADLAEEAHEDFVERFVEGLRVAMKLQAKNVIDNPIKAAAWEVFTAAGLDGSLAEKVAEYGIMETQVEALVKKALEYTEVSDETFAEIKAHAESLPYTKVAEGGAVNEDAEAEAIRAAMRRRASQPGIRTSRVGLPAEGLTKVASTDGGDDEGGALRRAIRAGSPAPVRPPTRGDRR